MLFFFFPPIANKGWCPVKCFLRRQSFMQYAVTFIHNISGMHVKASRQPNSYSVVWPLHNLKCCKGWRYITCVYVWLRGVSIYTSVVSCAPFNISFTNKTTAWVYDQGLPALTWEALQKDIYWFEILPLKWTSAPITHPVSLCFIWFDSSINENCIWDRVAIQNSEKPTIN